MLVVVVAVAADSIAVYLMVVAAGSTKVVETIAYRRYCTAILLSLSSASIQINHCFVKIFWYHLVYLTKIHSSRKRTLARLRIEVQVHRAPTLVSNALQTRYIARAICRYADVHESHVPERGAHAAQCARAPHATGHITIA